MKKFTLVAAIAAVASLTLAACGGGATPDTSAPTTSAAGNTTVKVGITQIVSHPALDDVVQGFKDALADGGYDAVFDEQNAQGDVATAASIAGAFADGDFDLICAVATPTAQAVAQAITDVPVFFAAVTDPVAAGLVASLEEPGANVTGTSDKGPVREQLELITKLLPDAKTVGVVYSSAEENSLVQLAWAEEEAAKLGLTLQTATIANSSDLKQAAESLDVDAYYVFTDNTVVSALESLLGVAEARGVPVVTSDADSVARGAIATYAFDYYDMGYQTGQMAVRYLDAGGSLESIATMPVETSQDLYLKLNLAAAERIGIQIPQDLLDEAGSDGLLG